jgi:hypothetical protein
LRWVGDRARDDAAAPHASITVAMRCKILMSKAVVHVCHPKHG